MSEDSARGSTSSPRAYGWASIGALVIASAVAAQAPPLSPNVPHDIDTRGVPNNLPAMQAAFDRFSWQSFVALAWPARADGTPDPGRTIGQGGDASSVFERWPMAEDVFVPPSTLPAPWGSPPHVPAACAAATRVFTMFTKAPATPAGVVSEFAQALSTGPLVDRNGEFVRYAVQLSRDAFDFIVNNRLYVPDAQGRFGTIAFPAGTLTGDRIGAITTKAAWKVLGAGDDRSRFHRTTAWVYTPAGDGVPESCVQKDLGLVGFHIAHKTQSRPQWIWSTFEQVDNAPPATAPRAATFYNPSCTGAACTPNVAVSPPWDPSKPGTPTQVTRVTPIADGTAAVNAQWQAALRSVDSSSPWQYYELVATQWPTRPGDTKGIGMPAPQVVANTVIETFIQSGGRGAASSCALCHRGATVFGSSKAADYSYLLLRAQAMSRAQRP